MGLYCSPEYHTSDPWGGPFFYPYQLDTSNEVLPLLAFLFRRRGSIQIFKMATMAAILDYQSERFYFFFLLTSHPNTSCQVSSQLTLWFRVRSSKQIFKMAARAAMHLDFLIIIILAIFDLVNWPYGSGVEVIEVRNRFSRWRPWQPSWISDMKKA